MRIPNRGLRRLIGDFKRHPWLHLMSIFTISVSLIISGVFLQLFTNFSHIAEHSDPKQTGTLYLDSSLNSQELDGIKDQVKRLDIVENVKFKSKSTVLTELQSFMGSSLGNSPGSELFPDLLELTLKKEASPAQIQSLRNELALLPGISEVDFSDDWSFQFQSFFKVLRVVGILLLLGIFVGCSFMIANFMGLRHQSRKNEIDIVRLIGGDQKFVLSPFLWEGVVEGIVGSIAALLFLVALKYVIMGLFHWHWASVLGVRDWTFFSFAQIFILLAFGVLMACSGSITVFMRFREQK